MDVAGVKYISARAEVRGHPFPDCFFMSDYQYRQHLLVKIGSQCGNSFKGVG
jgi:hypothetical protein